MTNSFSATPFFISRPAVAVQMTSTSYSIAAATDAWKIGAPSSSPLRGSVLAITITSFFAMASSTRGGDCDWTLRDSARSEALARGFAYISDF